MSPTGITKYTCHYSIDKNMLLILIIAEDV